MTIVEKFGIIKGDKEVITLKKAIPVMIAIVLIILVGLGIVGVKLYEKYSYGKERANLKEYFENISDDDVAIILQDERLEVKAKIIEGNYYFDWDTVKTYFNDRFYVSSNENTILYTTPTDIISSEIGSSIYTISEEVQELDYIIATRVGETLYVACDYIQLYTNYDFTTYTDPNYMQVDTEWNSKKVATINRDTQVRFQGGIKSEILQDLVKGEQVTILEEMEEWSKVKTETSMIGYVPNKFLIDIRDMEETPVVNYVEPVYTSVLKDYTINLTWNLVYNQTANASLSEKLDETKGINVVSPTWFRLNDNEGNFESIASHDYVETAHARGIEVWVLVEEFTNGVDLKELLSYSHKRELLINNLINEVLTYQIDGINIDFETVSKEAGEDFIQFIRELSIACRANGIVLSIDNYVPMEHTDHYNRTEQGIVADYVIIMGYDEHYAKSEVAGSVASIDFVDGGIERTLQEVPAEKIINAVPFYTRIWITENGEFRSEALAMSNALKAMADKGVEPIWDETTCQYYSEVEVDGIFYQCWFEEKESLAVKLNVMKNYNIAGVASWKLGFETPEIWDVIESYTSARDQK